MDINIIRKRATPAQFKDMLKALHSSIKLAVDIEREVVAGGGMLHADCEAVLLEDGSKQKDIWGADWLPDSKKIRFEALINIRPRQNNRSMTIQDKMVHCKVEKIVREKLNNEES